MIPAKSILPFVLPALAAMITPAAVGQSRSPVTIVDSLGREIVVPGRVERIISLEPEVTRIIVALGEGKRLVGIDFFLRHHDRLFPFVFPPSERLPVVSNQGQDLNYEEAIRLRPDIIFSSPSEFRMTEAIEKKCARQWRRWPRWENSATSSRRSKRSAGSSTGRTARRSSRRISRNA